MEELSESVELQYFDRLGVAEAVVPLEDLPQAYRFELDRGFTTGWRSLDRYMQGVRRGEVTVITADTGVGKTTFATQLCVNAAMQGRPVWINSWEMKPAIIMRKIASIVLRKSMKLQNFTERDNEQFNFWCSRYHIYINPNTIGTTLASLSKQLAHAKTLGVELVMLDHLDYLVNHKKEKIHEAIDETVKILHELAFFHSLHIILICHPRQAFNAADEVGIHSLKGSASIKQYADNILILHRCSRSDKQADPSKTKIHIAKNRMFGIEGYTYLFYQPWDGYVELKEDV